MSIESKASASLKEKLLERLLEQPEEDQQRILRAVYKLSGYRLAIRDGQRIVVQHNKDGEGGIPGLGWAGALHTIYLVGKWLNARERKK